MESFAILASARVAAGDPIAGRFGTVADASDRL